MPPVAINETPMSHLSTQKYLGVIFDITLNFSSHVANICKSMAYYLYSINYRKILPTQVLKMLVESLIFSQLSYALPVWGPALHQDSLRRITRLRNRAVHITCGLTKSDHISHPQQAIGWLSPTMLVQHRSLCAMLDQYSKGISLDPPR